MSSAVLTPAARAAQELGGSSCDGPRDPRYRAAVPMMRVERALALGAKPFSHATEAAKVMVQFIWKALTHLFRKIAQALGVRVKPPSEADTANGTGAALVDGESRPQVHEAATQMATAANEHADALEALLQGQANLDQVAPGQLLQGVVAKRMSDLAQALQMAHSVLSAEEQQLDLALDAAAQKLGIGRGDVQEMIRAAHKAGQLAALETGPAGDSLRLAGEAYVRVVEQRARFERARSLFTSHGVAYCLADPDGQTGAVTKLVHQAVERLPHPYVSLLRSEIHDLAKVGREAQAHGGASQQQGLNSTTSAHSVPSGVHSMESKGETSDAATPTQDGGEPTNVVAMSRNRSQRFPEG